MFVHLFMYVRRHACRYVCTYTFVHLYLYNYSYTQGKVPQHAPHAQIVFPHTCTIQTSWYRMQTVCFHNNYVTCRLNSAPFLFFHRHWKSPIIILWLLNLSHLRLATQNWSVSSSRTPTLTYLIRYLIPILSWTAPALTATLSPLTLWQPDLNLQCTIPWTVDTHWTATLILRNAGE